MNRQKELCEKLAKEKGWPIVEVFADNDLSAYSGKSRPAYERMLADIEAGLIDALVAWHPDRLHRSPVELENFINLVEQKKIKIAMVQVGSYDLTTASGRMTARIVGDVARYESEHKADRIRASKDEAASKGWAQGGKRRYGYTHARNDKGKATLLIVPHEADIVREVVQRLLGGEALRPIAKDLNSRGEPTATGKQWRVGTITTMLAGPHLTGLRVHRGEVAGNGNWEPILDRATWEQVQAVLNSQPKKKGRPAEHLLTGILKCSKCGGPLYHSTREGGKTKYYCSPITGTKSCGKTSISAGPVETMVTEAVLDVLDSLKMTEVLTKPVDDDDPAEVILEQIEQAEESMKRLSVLHFVDDKLSELEYLAARDGLETKISELRDQLVPDTPAKALASSDVSVRESWTAADTDTRRSIIATVIARIMVGPGQRGRPVDPSRLDIEWSV